MPAKARTVRKPPRLTEAKIIKWAREHRKHHGNWPTKRSGPIPGSRGETWSRIDRALTNGHRGLEPSSLAKLLDKYGYVRPRTGWRPRLTIRQILQWAREHHERTGRWPTRHAGKIPGTDETWERIDKALWNGHRGLPGDSSLSQLLTKHGKSRVPPRPTADEILDAADRYKRRHGEYPTRDAGVAIPKTGITWQSIEQSLNRNPPEEYPDATSLKKLLQLARGERNPRNLPRLNYKMILKWARAHHRRTGEWPNKQSGDIPESPAPGETWYLVATAMDQGQRGLSGKTTLAGLLRRHGYERRRVYVDKRPKLTIRQILKWADAYYLRHGEWPAWATGPIKGARGERWERVAEALHKGRRGLPEGWTMRSLLAEHRGYNYRVKCPDVTEHQIARWAQRHYRETGEWPLRRSGPVIGGHPHDTWNKLDVALQTGSRSLPGGSSLPRLLFEYFGVQRRSDLYLKKTGHRSRKGYEGTWLDPNARRPDQFKKKKKKKQVTKSRKKKKKTATQGRSKNTAKKKAGSKKKKAKKKVRREKK